MNTFILEYPVSENGTFRLRQLLPAGNYRFSFQFRILANDHGNRDLIQAFVMDVGVNVKLAAGSLPRKKDSPDSPYRRFHVDFTLDEATEVEGQLFLSSAGRVEIDAAAIAEKVFPTLAAEPQVLLINPDRHLSAEKIVHQGLAAIATYLEEQSISCHIANTSQCDDDFIQQQIQRHPYKAFGFFVTSDETVVGYVRDLVAKIKQLRPDALFMAGGPHATLDAEQLLRGLPDMDICVRGEGEETCSEILLGLPLNTIRGITYRDKGGQIVATADRSLLPAEKLPMAARHVYLQPDWTAHSISTSRGCPHHCHFCIGHEIFGRTIRFKPLELIEQELQWIYEHEDHTKVVSINDDMFNMDRRRTLELMEIMRQYPFHYFPRGVRADRLDAETARAMGEAGVIGTSIGVESADNAALAAMCKGETIEDIERGIRHLRDNHIAIVAMFMIGNVGDTLETTKKTIDFALKYKFEALNMSCAIPFPGTFLRNYVVTNNLLLETPHVAATGIVNGSTTIFFETPEFPLADRIKAVDLALEAGLLQRAREEVPRTEKSEGTE